MTDRDNARAQIAALVEKFDRTPKKEIAGYTEQQMRVSFILPLFQALGWDTTNPAEMSAEENISRGFVDFGFYLHGVPVFYLETKRAREDITRTEYMKQAINYAYLKGVTWAVLTDFDEMMVFNAEWEDDDPEKTRLFHFRHADYAGGSFDDLWLLSKEAMGASEIDHLAERVGRKAKREPVTSILFKQLTDWRFRLFQNITTMKTTLWATDPHEVDNAVQKLIDRLIFIRSMEDRGIEEARLQPLLRQKRRGDYFAELQKLFRELDGIYNSNLFAQSNLDYMELHDPDLVREIIDGLYIIEKGRMARYDFNAIDADVLGAVYEQYLGFKALDPQGKNKLDPRKREKRKAQGIYYTPKFVVRYIVQATLGRKLAEGADAHKLRILDPACGSGSFLIEAFDVLDRHFATVEPTEDPQKIAERRQRILRDNLFGVDLDDQAVEVTRLNLALRAAYTREKLPYLTNIKHGNSLIDDPAVAGATAFKWEERFAEVMEAGGFDVVIGNPPYVRQESLGEAFKKYAATRYETYTGTADLYQYFIERSIKLLRSDGIYGVIVANKWMRANYGKPLRAWLKAQRLEEIIDFGDLPVFPEATTYPCIIVARPTNSETAEDNFAVTQVKTLDFLTLESYAAQHRYSARRASLNAAGWSLSQSNKEALFQKVSATGIHLDKFVEDRIFIGVKTGFNKAFIIDDNLRRILVEEDPKSADIIKPYLVGRNIKRYGNLGTQQHLIFTRRGIDIEKYPAISAHLSEFKTELVPKPRDYVGDDWAGRKAGAYKWFEIQDPVAYYIEFEKPKIVYAEIADRGQFSLDENRNFCDMTAFIIGSGSKYLLGLLNSRLMTYILSITSSQIRGGFLRWKRQYVEQLPIRTINFDDPADKARHDRMVALVETMLRLKREHAAESQVFSDKRHEIKEEIDRTDAQIDALVYELYGLTDEEIALVEGRGSA
jgi:type I restriction-modification system DNA methylase subunit